MKKRELEKKLKKAGWWLNLSRYCNGLNSSSFPAGCDARSWAILNQYSPRTGIATCGENNLEFRPLEYRDRFLDRHRGNHDIWTNGKITNQVPRHNEVNKLLARSIIKEAEKNPGEEK